MLVVQAFAPVTPTPIPTAPPAVAAPARTAPPAAAVSPAVAASPAADLAVPVHVTADITSATASAGQRFDFYVARDVFGQDGAVEIPKCTPGIGTVTFAQRAGGKGAAGSVKLRFDSLSLPDGSAIALDPAEQAFTGQDQHGKAARHRLGMYLLCGLLCQGGGANAVSGDEANVLPDEDLKAMLAGNAPAKMPAAPACPEALTQAPAITH